MAELTPSTALAARAPGGLPAVHGAPGLRIAERDQAKALIRCHRGRAEAAAALVARAGGWSLPLTPNTVEVQAGGRALWLEPGAWLLTGDAAPIAAVVGALAAIEADAPWILVTDLSSGRCLIEISGPRARAVIESGCPIDLHPRVFGPGRCASSLFGATPIVIDQRSDAPVFALMVDRASALDLWDQLVDAAALAPQAS